MPTSPSSWHRRRRQAASYPATRRVASLCSFVDELTNCNCTSHGQLAGSAADGHHQHYIAGRHGGLVTAVTIGERHGRPVVSPRSRTRPPIGRSWLSSWAIGPIMASTVRTRHTWRRDGYPRSPGRGPGDSTEAAAFVARRAVRLADTG